MQDFLLSVVVPMYFEEDVVRECYKRLTNVLHNRYRYELIFVNDGSTDRTLPLLEEIAAADNQVKVISFARNFGHQAAVTAGIHKAAGDAIVIIDADLQDPPALLPEMLKALNEEGYDIAASRRSTRQGEPVIRSFFARRFYSFINKVSTTKLVDGDRDFRLMKRPDVNAVLDLAEYNRFSKGIFEWVGFRTKWFSYENIERSAGRTKWPFWKLFKYSLEGIVAFTTAPLTVAVYTGLFFSLVAAGTILALVVRWCIYPDAAVSGWTSLVSIIAFFGGLQLTCIGILGQYLAKTYLEVKNRPIYIIGKKSA